MAAKTSIGWTNATWTPVRARVKVDAAKIARAKGYKSLVQIAEKMAGHVGPHCERVSAECDHCYSEANNGRCLPVNGTGLPFDRRTRDLVNVFVDGNILQQPLRWRTGKRIFVCSQTDLFGDFVSDEMIDRVFSVMARCRQHTFQVLTKRPERMMHVMTKVIRTQKFWPLPNVLLGVTAGTQETASERLPWLVKTPAAARFVSAEPLLGEVDLSAWIQSLDWVVTGGESGAGARPSSPKWFRSLRDQCQAAGVAYFHKQNGAWVSGENVPDNRKYATQVYTDAGEWLRCSDDWVTEKDSGPIMYRVGMKKAGRLLDGVEWNQFPEVRA